MLRKTRSRRPNRKPINQWNSIISWNTYDFPATQFSTDHLKFDTTWWLTRCFWYRSCGSQSEQVRPVVPNNGDCSCLISIVKPVICEQLTPNSKSSKCFAIIFGRNCSLKIITSFDLRSKKKRFFTTSENIIYRMADTDIYKLHWYFYTSKYLNNIFITR